MRVAICDDDKKDLATVIAAVKRYDTAGALELFAFTRAIDLYNQAKRTAFDIAILDIQMEDPNGYEIAKQLKEGGASPVIIFLTGSMEYTLRGYGIAFRYLIKPVDQSALEEALSKAVQEASSNRFVFSADGVAYMIPVQDILYFEVFNHNTVLHTKEQAYSFRGTLKELTEKLPPALFASPHQSYIVNLQHIHWAKTAQLQMTNGDTVPVSRRRQQEFEAQLYRYLGR